MEETLQKKIASLQFTPSEELEESVYAKMMNSYTPQGMPKKNSSFALLFLAFALIVGVAAYTLYPKQSTDVISQMANALTIYKVNAAYTNQSSFQLKKTTPEGNVYYDADSSMYVVSRNESNDYYYIKTPEKISETGIEALSTAAYRRINAGNYVDASIVYASEAQAVSFVTLKRDTTETVTAPPPVTTITYSHAYELCVKAPNSKILEIYPPICIYSDGRRVPSDGTTIQPPIPTISPIIAKKDGVTFTATFVGGSTGNKWIYTAKGGFPNACYSLRIDTRIAETASYPATNTQVILIARITEPAPNQACAQMAPIINQQGTFEAPPTTSVLWSIMTGTPQTTVPGSKSPGNVVVQPGIGSSVPGSPANNYSAAYMVCAQTAGSVIRESFPPVCVYLDGRTVIAF